MERNVALSFILWNYSIHSLIKATLALALVAGKALPACKSTVIKCKGSAAILQSFEAAQNLFDSVQLLGHGFR